MPARRPTLRVVTAPEPSPRLCIDPTARGYYVVYRRGEANFCPGCGRSQWYLGRGSAECAYCSTALPFERAG